MSRLPGASRELEKKAAFKTGNRDNQYIYIHIIYMNNSERGKPEFDSSNTERKPKHRKYDRKYMDKTIVLRGE